MAIPIFDLVFLDELLWIVWRYLRVNCIDAEHAVILHLYSLRALNLHPRRIMDVLWSNNIILAGQLNGLVSGIEPIRITDTLTQTQHDSQSDNDILFLLRCRLYWMQLAIVRGADLNILVELLHRELEEMEL